MEFLKHKLTRDITWSMGSFGVLAICGMVINLLIATMRDANALGIFNQVYAIYITAAQIAVFGLHYSVMRHSALHSDEHGELGRLVANAGFFALILGSLMAGVLILIAPIAGSILHSPATHLALLYAAPGLFLFPVNKVLLGFLNGVRRMKALAILQSLRYILLTIWIWTMLITERPFNHAVLGFLVSEAGMFACIIAYLFKQKLTPNLRFDFGWTRLHFSFGGRSLLAGIFVEMNSRIDVLMVGLFLPDRAVGIYSFAAMIADGMYQLLGVLRTTINPVLVSELKASNWASLQHLLSRAKKYTFPLAGVMAIALIIGFWFVTSTLMPSKGLQEGIPTLVILLSGLVLVSGFVPFDNLMLVSGRPGLQTFQNLIVVTANLGLNYFLIPVIGIMGAAIGTALSYVLGIIAIIVLAHRLLRWNLLTNFAWR